MTDKAQLLEAILFAAPRVISRDEISSFLELDSIRLADLVEEINSSLGSHPFTVVEVAGGYKMVTKPHYVVQLDRFYSKVKKRFLSRQALEVLAVVAYKQPVTRAAVEAIRGLNSEQQLRNLHDRRLIKVKGRAKGPGRPFLYATTPYFLEVFGLKDLSELPDVLRGVAVLSSIGEETSKVGIGSESPE